MNQAEIKRRKNAVRAFLPDMPREWRDAVQALFEIAGDPVRLEIRERLEALAMGFYEKQKVRRDFNGEYEYSLFEIGRELSALDHRQNENGGT